MTKRQVMTISAMLLLAGNAAIASDDSAVAFATEMDSCLAEVNDRADYRDATRVRHNVVELRNTFAGYVLSIDTDVFTESDEVAVREYSSQCVAKGDSKPKEFKIRPRTG